MRNEENTATAAAAATDAQADERRARVEQFLAENDAALQAQGDPAGEIAKRKELDTEPTFDQLRTDGLNVNQCKEVARLQKQGAPPMQIAGYIEKCRREGVEASDHRLEAYQQGKPRTGRSLADEERFQYYKRMNTEDVGEAPVPQSANYYNSDLIEFGIAYKDGVIMAKGKSSPSPISNFVFSILFHFDNGTTNTERLIKYENNDNGNVGTMILEDKTLSSVGDIRAAFASKNCVFADLNAKMLAGILRRAYLLEIPATKIDKLGYNAEGDFYAFANAIVLPGAGGVVTANRYGLVHAPQADGAQRWLYLPAFAEHNLNNPSFDGARQLQYDPASNMGANEFFKLLFKAWGLPGFVAGLYLANSLMFDIIFEHTHCFPFLFLFGKHGTGKTTLIRTLLGTISKGYEGDSFGSTQKAIARRLNQVNNSIVYLKEYTIGLPSEFVSMMKSAYDGQSYSIAQKTTGNDTLTFVSRTGVLVDGNDLPTDQAPLYDRFIVLELRKDTFTDAQSRAFDQLSKANESHTLTSVARELLQCRPTYKKHFARLYDAELERLKAGRMKDFDTRTIGHVAFMMAAYKALKKDYTLLEGIEEMFNEPGLEDYLFEVATTKKEDIKEMSPTSTFWQMAAPAIEESCMGDKALADFDRETNTLYITYTKLYIEYSKRCRNSGTKIADKTALRKFLTGQGYAQYVGYVTHKNKRRYSYHLAPMGDNYEIDGAELHLQSGF